LKPAEANELYETLKNEEMVDMRLNNVT